MSMISLERIVMSNVEKTISSEYQHFMEVENVNFRAENERLVKLGIIFYNSTLSCIIRRSYTYNLTLFDCTMKRAV